MIPEVFEKATTHHHFIDMYADLCEQLHEFFTENPIGNDAKNSFKKVLLGECQGSFERNLTAPVDLGGLTGEERTLSEIRFKLKMIGNVKFVDVLLADQEALKVDQLKHMA